MYLRAWRLALVLAHGEDSPHAQIGALEPLVDEWIDMLRWQAQSEGKAYTLDDLELARNARLSKAPLIAFKLYVQRSASGAASSV